MKSPDQILNFIEQIQKMAPESTTSATAHNPFFIVLMNRAAALAQWADATWIGHPGKVDRDKLLEIIAFIRKEVLLEPSAATSNQPIPESEDESFDSAYERETKEAMRSEILEELFPGLDSKVRQLQEARSVPPASPTPPVSLCRECAPGQFVFWSNVQGWTFTGTLKEWDNDTAIIEWPMIQTPLIAVDGGGFGPSS